jgi:hypothetical protein
MVLPYRRVGAPRGMEGAGSICQAEATAAAVARDYDSVLDEDFEAFIQGAGTGSFQPSAVVGMLSSLWEDRGMEVVGYPLGCSEYVKALCAAKVRNTVEAVTAISRLAEYGNPVALQTAYLQLRFCAEPRIART